MTDRISEILVKYRYAFFIASILVVIATGTGLQYLKMDIDYKSFFDKDNPQLIAHELVQNTYSKADNALFIIAPEDKQVFTKQRLQQIQEMTEDGWTLPNSMRVDSLSNYQHTYSEVDDLIVEDLYENTEELTQERLDKIREIVLNEPLLVHRLIAADGDVTTVNVEFELAANDTEAIKETMMAVRAMRDKYEERYPDAKIYLIGQTPINFAFTEVTEQDSAKLIPFMMAFIIILLLVLLRSFMAMVATLFLTVMGIVFTLGITGLLGWSLNSVNATAPIIILTLAVADSVHLLNSYFSFMSKGMSKAEAMLESCKLNIQALFLTSFTTSIGFLSMNFSDSPPFREFGNMSAMGVAITFVFCLTMTPTIMLLLSRQRKPSKNVEKTPYLVGFANFVIKHYKPVFFGSLAVALGLASLIPLNDLNDDSVEYFHPNTEIRQAADFAEHNLAGSTFIEYSLDSGEGQGINDPGYLAKVEAFVEWYRAQPEVVHVNTYTDTIKRLNRNMNSDDDAYYKLPDSRELAAQYQLLYEMSLPFGLDLTNQINVDKSSLRISATLVNLKAKQLIAFEDRVQAWFQENAPELASVGSSPSIMFAHVGQRNIVGMLWGTLVAVFLISFTLILFFRSVKYGAISLLPNMFPAAMAFGAWGFFVGEVNLGAAAVYTITLGIVVDDTVHFMTKYLRARQKLNMDAYDSIRYAFEKVGNALVITSIVLAVGFFTLAFSYFDVNATMGKMVSATIVIAIVFDFLFLPALLIMVSGVSKTGEVESDQDESNINSKRESKKSGTDTKKPDSDLIAAT